MLDTLIKNAKIVDGSLKQAYAGDIGIAGDKIQEIGDLSGREAHDVLDAQGAIACPGFIDVHSHSDFSCLALGSSDSKVFQGVTTEVIGNCGLSSAPLAGACKEHLTDSYGNLGFDLDWSDLAEYRHKAESGGISVNLVPLIGHGNIRACIMGYEDRNPTAQELNAMKALLKKMLEQGAYGMSTGLIYPPGIFSTTEELIALGKVLEEHQGIYASHMRSEGDRLLESIEETLTIGRQCGVPVQISHLKTAGTRNWHKLEKALALIADARAAGVEVHVDRYPYTAASTDLDSIFPSWAFAGGNEKEIQRLQDPATLARIRKEVMDAHPDAEYWQRVMVASVETERNRCWEGKTIAQIAEARQSHPFEALTQLLLEERLKVQAIFFSMSEDNLKEILKQPYTMIGSDSSSRAASGKMSAGKPHPRSYGTFPRVLAKFVQQERTISLEDAVHKMTLLPARSFRLPNRGLLAAGMIADIVLLDGGTVKDTADFQNPHQYPEGISWVFVNGAAVVRQGKHTGAKPGKVLLRS